MQYSQNTFTQMRHLQLQNIISILSPTVYEIYGEKNNNKKRNENIFCIELEKANAGHVTTTTEVNGSPHMAPATLKQRDTI